MTWHRLWRDPWTRRVIVALSAASLVLTWRYWLPVVLAWVPLIGEHADELQGIDVLVDWAVRVIAVVVLLVWPRRSSPPTVLIGRRVNDEIGLCTDHGQTPWTPRTPDPAGFLTTHPRFVFRDGAGAGKTREALELIRHHAGRPVRMLVTPNWGARFDDCTPDVLEDALNRLPLADGPVALWLDDLHLHSERRACDRISELISILERRLPGDRLFVVGTMRDEVSLDAWQECFGHHGIRVQSLKSIDRGALQAIAADMARSSGMELTEPAHDAIWRFPDHRPELLRSAFGRLRDEGEIRPDRDRVLATLARGLSELWHDERKGLVRGEPSVEPMLEALELLYAARQHPHVGIVRALAHSRARTARARLGLALRRGEGALRQHRYFAIADGRWRGSEVALHARCDAADALHTLARFVDMYRRYLRCWPLRVLDGSRDQRKWLAMGLAGVYQDTGDFESASSMYSLALSIVPRSHEPLVNWGHALAKKAEESVSRSRSQDLLMACDAAEGCCRQALAIEPDVYEAELNWGMALGVKATVLAAAGRTDEALIACDAACEHCQRALSMQPSEHQAAYNWGKALGVKALVLANAGFINQALLTSDSAIERYRQALSFRPGMYEAASNLGAELVAKAALLASQNRSTEALVACHVAEQRCQDALSIKPEAPEAANNWSTALILKARLLARLNRIGEALAAYDDAGDRFLQALALEPGEDRGLFGLSLELEALAWQLAASDRLALGIVALRMADRYRTAFSEQRPLLAWHYYRRWYIGTFRDEEEAAAQDLQTALTMESKELDTIEPGRTPEPSNLFNLGLYLLAARQEDAALGRYREGLAVRPSDEDIAQARLELGALGALIGPEAVEGALRLLGGSSPSPVAASVPAPG